MKQFLRMFFIGAMALGLGSCATYRNTGSVVDSSIGVPKRKPFKGHQLVLHSNYCSAFSKKHNQPAWVAWTLSTDELERNVKRTNRFYPDPQVKNKHRVEWEDYRGSEFDKGHLCPAMDNRFSAKAMKESFFMTNMCPQLHKFNAGIWQSLEDSCQVWAERHDGVVVVAGPLFYHKKPGTIGKEHKVCVPDAFFKVVYSPKLKKAIGFILSHTDSYQTLTGAACSVRSVENATGLDFFPNLPKKLQKELETKSNLDDWR